MCAQKNTIYSGRVFGQNQSSVASVQQWKIMSRARNDNDANVDLYQWWMGTSINLGEVNRNRPRVYSTPTFVLLHLDYLIMYHRDFSEA